MLVVKVERYNIKIAFYILWSNLETALTAIYATNLVAISGVDRVVVSGKVHGHEVILQFADDGFVIIVFFQFRVDDQEIVIQSVIIH